MGKGSRFSNYRSFSGERNALKKHGKTSTHNKDKDYAGLGINQLQSKLGKSLATLKHQRLYKSKLHLKPSEHKHIRLS